ncbi:MAG: complex I subunit 5 family protein [Faecalibacterium sp.]
MDMVTTTPLGAQIMLAAILLPLVCGLLGWLCNSIGNFQHDFVMRTFAKNLFYGGAILGFAAVVLLPEHLGASFSVTGFSGLGLSFMLDGLRLILCVLTSFCWLIVAVFTPEALKDYPHKSRFLLFMLITESATLGVFLSADLFTTLVCFEIMSIASWVMVAHEESPKTKYAADSYLAFAVLGGLATLMGLFLLYNALGTLTIAELATAAAAYDNKALLYVAGGLTMVGFAAKAGMFPFHTWMPTAYVATPAPGTALLSAILSKAGLFGILALSTQLFMHDADFGMVIVTFGLITMVLGGVLGVFSVNLKRTLACSSMSQIGFILVGIGMQCILGEEGTLAIWGVILHICNHSLFKLCLFLCAGVIFANLKEFDLNKIRGYGRGKWVLMYTFGMAAIGIGGVPLWSGYISKTLLHESIVEGIAHLAAHGEATLFLECSEWIFLISGGLTVAYMAKLFVCVFLEKNQDPALQAQYDAQNGMYINKVSAAALVLIGSISPILGLTPHLSMEGIAALANDFTGSENPAHAVEYFALHILKGGAISLGIGALIYFVVVRKLFLQKGVYRDLWPSKLNLEDGLYRPLLLRWLPFVGALCARLCASIFEWLRAACCKVLFWDDHDGVVTPAEDTRFTIYEQLPTGIRGFSGSLAFSLMMFGFGMVAILLYLVFQYA